MLLKNGGIDFIPGTVLIQSWIDPQPGRPGLALEEEHDRAFPSCKMNEVILDRPPLRILDHSLLSIGQAIERCIQGNPSRLESGEQPGPRDEIEPPGGVAAHADP